MSEAEKTEAEREPDEAEAASEQLPAEPFFNMPAVVVSLIAVCAAVHVVRTHVLTADQDFWVIVRFAFVPIRYSGGYALDAYAAISPLSYSVLHGGYAHLVVNMIWLAAFGSPLANRIGTARFLWFWAVTALAAVLLHFVLHHDEAVPLVGASGAISGMMGAAARFGFRIDRRSGQAAFAGEVLPVAAVFRSRAAVTFLAVWMVVNLVTGLGFGDMGGGAGIAWEAHIGGFLAGFAGIGLFDRRIPPAAPTAPSP